ncbi:sensor histidine kinase [Granulosicoccus sp. 3-233]|uniref:sensor histidine kinase n=1 Tax=Granulosicoccus sp. 3-233 TaxID=3417969 RepID=UPI003D348A02
MTRTDSSADTQAMHVPNSSGNSWKPTLWLIICSVATVLAIQTWSNTGIVRGMADLRAVLSQANDTAHKLERRLGYGGLIHNFKNYVLRPEEDNYRVSAYADATEALSLLELLQTSAMKYGIDAPLASTHEMLESYAQRLGTIRELSSQGLNSRSIDQQVRFDDEAALQEVQMVLENLDAAIDDRLQELYSQGTITSLLSTVSTMALGLLIIAVVARRQQRHSAALAAFTEHLTNSNNNLASANTSLRQFAGIVSHDLKTPIRYIHTFNRMIVEDAASPQAVEQHVDLIDQQVHQMDLIIDSLLDFTKVGFTQPAMENIDINRLFSDIEYDLRSDIDRHRASIRFRNDLDMTVQADPGQLTRLFVNLIGNSLIYAHEDTPAQVFVQAKSDGESVVFSVADNGIGIEPRFATKIFEPMIRLHGPQSQYKGVGIGLSLAKTIVENHGGHIWLDTGYKHGTCFSFSLPLAQGTQQKQAA